MRIFRFYLKKKTTNNYQTNNINQATTSTTTSTCKGEEYKALIFVDKNLADDMK